MKGAVALAAILAAAGCAPPRRGEPLAGPVVVTEAGQDRGRVVFQEHCYKCHPGGEAGLGPALTRRTLPWRVKRFHDFDRSRIDDKQLEDLTAYLNMLRRGTDRLHEPFEARELREASR